MGFYLIANVPYTAVPIENWSDNFVPIFLQKTCIVVVLRINKETKIKILGSFCPEIYKILNL